MSMQSKKVFLWFPRKVLTRHYDNIPVKETLMWLTTVEKVTQYNIVSYFSLCYQEI